MIREQINHQTTEATKEDHEDADQHQECNCKERKKCVPLILKAGFEIYCIVAISK